MKEHATEMCSCDINNHVKFLGLLDLLDVVTPLS